MGKKGLFGSCIFVLTFGLQGFLFFSFFFVLTNTQKERERNPFDKKKNYNSFFLSGAEWEGKNEKESMGKVGLCFLYFCPNISVCRGTGRNEKWVVAYGEYYYYLLHRSIVVMLVPTLFCISLFFSRAALVWLFLNN